MGLMASPEALAESTTPSHGSQGLQVLRVAVAKPLQVAGIPHGLFIPPQHVCLMKKGENKEMDPSTRS